MPAFFSVKIFRNNTQQIEDKNKGDQSVDIIGQELNNKNTCRKAKSCLVQDLYEDRGPGGGDPATEESCDDRADDGARQGDQKRSGNDPPFFNRDRSAGQTRHETKNQADGHIIQRIDINGKTHDKSVQKRGKHTVKRPEQDRDQNGSHTVQINR